MDWPGFLAGAVVGMGLVTALTRHDPIFGLALIAAGTAIWIGNLIT
jgi:hypothetical protein